jgi:HPt (histidine-containing phosphotransfer) domain-containing protein
MDEYLTKPLDPQKLIQVISKLVTRSATSASGSSTVRDRSSDGAPQEAESTQSGKVHDVPPINLDFLNKQWGSDEGFVQTLLARFHSRAPIDLSGIEAAASDGNLQEVARIAHRLKGSSGYVAANAIGMICEKLEEAAAAGERESIDELAGQLRLELDRCLAFIVDSRAERVV